MSKPLREICAHWAGGRSHAEFDLEARAMGEELNARGGMRLMQSTHAALSDMRGARSLDMVWNRIGQWMG